MKKMLANIFVLFFLFNSQKNNSQNPPLPASRIDVFLEIGSKEMVGENYNFANPAIGMILYKKNSFFGIKTEIKLLDQKTFKIGTSFRTLVGEISTCAGLGFFEQKIFPVYSLNIQELNSEYLTKINLEIGKKSDYEIVLAIKILNNSYLGILSREKLGTGFYLFWIEDGPNKKNKQIGFWSVGNFFGVEKVEERLMPSFKVDIKYSFFLRKNTFI